MSGMRNLAPVILAVSGMLASTAQAQTAEVEEVGGGPCGNVTPSSHEAGGMCEFEAHSVGGVTLEAHLSAPFEVVGSVCSWEFEGYVATDGSGYLTHQVLVDSECTTPPCSEPSGNDLWPIRIREDGPHRTEREQMETHVCLVSSTFGQIVCEFEIDVIGSPGNYSFEAEDRQCTNMTSYPRFEVTGHWELEDQTIDIHHHDDEAD